MIADDETLQIFFSETEELLKQAEESLLSLESSPQSVSDIEQLFRSVHTLKSGAGMVGYNHISDYAHLVESLLERLRSGKLTVTNNLVTFLLDSIDFIRSMVDRVSQGQDEVDPEVFDKRKDQVRRYLGVDGISSSEKEPEPVKVATKKPAIEFSVYKIDLKFRRELFYSGQDPLLILLSLSELGEFVQVVPDLSEFPDFEKFSMYDLYISWKIIIKTEHSYEDIENVFMFVIDDNDIRIEDITNQYREGVDIDLAEQKLGQVLVEKGKITEEILTDALKKQKRLGDILVEDGKLHTEDLQKAVAEQEERRAVYRKTTIRVDVEKIDSLVNLGEEMGIGLAKVKTLFEKYTGPGQMEIMEEVENLFKINQDFQERVQRVRMFSLEGTFQRFQRMARDLAFQQNKKIKVMSAGLDTELDKEVIEYSTDPLKHLVRNCIDHGIESPEERQAKGKSPTGIIKFEAYQRGGKVFVEISDDGKGIDLKSIHSKAVEIGWIESNQALTEEALLDFLFKPGFSTSSKVSEISGRGVGMDVVKTQLDQIGGTINIHTEKDKGTTFILCLPLISALMEALHVMVRDTSFLVPLQSVVGTERFDNRLVKGIGAREKLYRFRGDYIPLADMTNILHFGILTEKGINTAVVFVDTGTKVFGMPVDEVLDPLQIIVKTLETNYRSVKGIAGATILGDGSVSLVLDLLGLEEIFFRNSFKGDTAHENEKKTEQG